MGGARSSSAAFATASVFCLLTADALVAHAQPAPAPVVRATQPATDYPIDLIHVAPGVPLRFPSFSAARAIRLVLKSRLPSAHYVVTVEGAATPIPPIRLTPAKPAAFTGVPADPNCAALQSAEAALLQAIEELDLYMRQVSLEGLLASSGCPEGQQRAHETLAKTQSIVALVAFKPKEPLHVTIDRLDKPGGGSVRKWQLTIDPPADGPVTQSEFRTRATQATPTAGARTQVTWTQRDESEWLTAEIIHKSAVLVQRARGTTDEPTVKISTLGAPGATTQRIELTLGRDTIPIDAPAGGEHAWSPDAFVGISSQLMSRFGLKPGRPSERTGSALGPLSALRATTLVAENRRISSWLEQEPLSAQAHEQAALLLGAFALREAARGWHDTRRAMCAMTARLALAQVLRRGAPASLDGTFARLTLETLAGRERPTLAMLAALKTSGDPAARTWLDALKLRNSRDWRIPTDAKTATLLQRLEHYRALAATRGSDAALAFLGGRMPEPIPDWGLIAAEASLTVAAGNALAKSLVPSVQEEVAEVWKAISGKALPAVLPLSVLNQTAPAGVADVLGWSLWAGFFERHLLAAADATLHYYDYLVGLRNQGQVFRVWASKELGPLQGFTLLEAQWTLELDTSGKRISTPEEIEQACARAVPILRSQPERVPAYVWWNLQQDCHRQSGSSELPGINKWYSLVAPRGTAYDAESRLDLVPLRAALGSAEAAALRTLPLCSAIILDSDSTARTERPLTGAAFRQACGSVLDYDISSLWRLVFIEERDDPQDLRARRKLCELVADECLALGERLAAQRLYDEAATAYRRGAEHAVDRVGVSNEMDFLVDYEFDRGRVEKAEELATMAAQVYSSAGLETLARLRERMGRYEEAESVYRQVAERYNFPSALDSFYIRYQKRKSDSRYRSEASAAEKRLFPEGLQRVMTLDFKLDPRGAPIEPGYEIVSGHLHPELEHFGVELGDVILAIDGYRVYNGWQYSSVRSFTDAQPMKLILWRRGQFLELEGNYRRRRFGPRTIP